jgi:hypothetical protein
MDGTTIDIAIFAPLAPILGVILFWFIQLIFIESQKLLLEKIRPKHEPFCRFTNFLGIFFQTICHALGYTVTKSGISDFYISISYGKVAPKKEKKGIFEWIANFFLFVGPFFIPAFLLLLCLFLIRIQGFDTTIPTHLADFKYTFGGQMTSFGTNLYRFSNGFFTFLANIDLLHPGHFGFLILMIFLGLGIRPSHIGEQKIDKVDMIYDLRNIWNLITNRKRYVLLVIIIGYIFFYISFLLGLNWYIILFSIFGWLSIISIVSLIITHLLLLLIKTTDKIEGKKKYIPYIFLPASYILMRLLFLYIKTEHDLSISLLVMILLTILVTYYIKKGKTNKLKTKKRIKLFKRKNKEKDND